MSRPRKQEPATAYEYRRYIELVQILSLENEAGMSLLALCKAWGIQPIGEWVDVYADHVDEGFVLDYKATVRLLAEHCIQWKREGEA